VTRRIMAKAIKRRKGKSARRASRKSIVSFARIERAILMMRGEKVILDADLAEPYGVETRALTRAVRRNIDRFRKISCSNLPRRSLAT